MSLVVNCMFVSVTDYHGDWILKHSELGRWTTILLILLFCPYKQHFKLPRSE